MAAVKAMGGAFGPGGPFGPAADGTPDAVRAEVRRVRDTLGPRVVISPSHEAILSTVKSHTDMVMVGMHEIGIDYAKTLAAWRRRFLARLEQVRALGFDDSFIRMWNYYLCYCQGGFEERVIGTAQILLAKPGWQTSASHSGVPEAIASTTGRPKPS